jgi:hypothetical protein
MSDLCKLTFGMVIDLLRSRATLEAEILLVCAENLNTGVMVMKSAQDGA